MSLSDAIFELKMHKNVFEVGVLPWTPLGSLQHSTTALSWINEGPQNSSLCMKSNSALKKSGCGRNYHHHHEQQQQQHSHHHITNL